MLGRYVCTKDQPNLLLPQYQQAIEIVFQKGIVFGNRLTHIVMDNSYWAFRTYEQFVEYVVGNVERGDQYEIWSLPDLISQGFILAHGKRSGNRSSIPMPSERELQAVRTYLDRGHNGTWKEFVAIFAEDDSDGLEVFVDDEDGYDDLIEYVDGSDGGTYDEVWVLPYTDFEQPEHMYLQARYPNERGEVPVWQPN
jgi:hypothetical protein